MADTAKTTQSKTDKKKAPAKKAVAKKVTKKADAVVEATPVEAATVNTEATTPVVETSTPEAKVEAPTAEKVEKKATPKSGTYTPEFDLTEMLETGAHFGHQARRWHPKMAPYIYQKRDGVHIIDLIKTADLLVNACNFAYELGKNGKNLIFVGTKRQAQEIVKAEAMRSGAMYVINRWMGGFISNWDQIQKSIRRMMDIRKGLETGKFDQYTKKERVVLDKEAQRLERFFAGVSELKTKPDALFIIDLGHEKTALKEASEAGISVIGLVDTNDDPTDVDYVIPANDDAVRSIEYFVKAVADAYAAGRNARK